MARPFGRRSACPSPALALDEGQSQAVKRRDTRLVIRDHAVSDDAWAEYLYFNANPKGASREIWLHLTCMEMFAMTRDTATNAVIGSEPMRTAP